MRKVTQGVTQQDKDNIGGTASEEFGGGTLVSLLKRALVFFHCDFGLSFSRVRIFEEKKTEQVLIWLNRVY